MSLFFYKKENNWVCVFCILMAIVFCGLMIVSVVALFIPKFNIETKSILDFNTLLSVLSLTLNISSYKNEHKNLEKFLQSMNLF